MTMWVEIMHKTLLAKQWGGGSVWRPPQTNMIPPAIDDPLPPFKSNPLWTDHKSFQLISPTLGKLAKTRPGDGAKPFGTKKNIKI